jgi:hypothetical protein
MRHPSLAAEAPIAVDIGRAELAPLRRSSAATGPVLMRGARLVGVPDDPRPMVVARKPETRADVSRAHAN